MESDDEVGIASDRISAATPREPLQFGEEETPIHDQSLPRVDGGRSAWTLLLAAFVFESVLWGFPLSFGILQSYYTTLPQFQGSKFITYVGTIATGIPYMGAPVVVPSLRRFSRFQRPMIWVGWCICELALVGASFATNVAELLIFQGFMYGLGYIILFYPIINLMNEWWVQRRGFAWGITIASSGASGVVYPFIIDWLLRKHGYQTALRVLAVSTAILTGPLLPFFKGRLPLSRTSVGSRTNWSFLRMPLFWLYVFSSAVQSLGFYLPSLYLPSYAAALGLSSRIGAVLLASLSVSQMLGQITYGYLSDGRLPLNFLIISTGVVGAVASLTLWGLAKSIVPLIVFALIYGYFAYAFMAMRVRMGTAVTTDQSASMAMFCIFSFVQGIGNVLAGPLSGALLEPEVDVGEYGYARYRPLIIFTGCCLMFSAASLIMSSVFVWARTNIRPVAAVQRSVPE